MNVATETPIETVTETSAEIVVTIDGVTFTADEAATLTFALRLPLLRSTRSRAAWATKPTGTQ